jgi:hypothetical protein
LLFLEPVLKPEKLYPYSKKLSHPKKGCLP